MKAAQSLIFLLFIALFTNCQQASRARKIEPDLHRSTAEEPFSSRDIADSVLFHYIGCGGFLIRKGDEAVLIDPYFSNASICNILFCHLQTDIAVIDSFFIKNFKNARDAEGVIQTVLIAHAHHDHLADLPSLLKRNLFSKKITVIGSQTAKNILQSFDLPFDAQRQMMSFDTLFDKKDSPPTRYISANSRVRITAIKTEHAPHFLCMKLPCIGGEVKKIPKSPPKTAFGFKEGVNYNFMIDFLNTDGAIDFRIFSSAGAAANAPIGFPPPSVLSEKKIDVLLLCGANYNQVKGYPEKLIAVTKPKKVFVAHWENFFVSIPRLLNKPLVVPITNIPKFLKNVKKAMIENGIEPTPIIVKPLTQVFIKY